MRRKDRRDRMLRSLEALGIDVTLIDAVDGKYDIITHTFASVTQCQHLHYYLYCMSFISASLQIVFFY